jgi:nicotinate-nucleotide adenylyltransferase
VTAPASSARRGPRRLGVFGGTFDPPHLGHLAIAECARDQLRLEQVVFIPSGQPPHKRRRPVTPARHRLAMIRLAVRGHPGFRVSTCEMDRGGASYTADTLTALRAEQPGVRLYLVIGEDSLDELHAWRDPQRILALATLAVAPRLGVAKPPARPARAAGAGRVVWLESPRIELSSSEIRRRARSGRSLRYLVPEPVRSYVLRHRLYRS